MKTASLSDLAALREENKQLRHQILDFEKLYKALEAVSSSLQVNEVVEHITEEALDLCLADEGSIVLFDPSGKSEAKTLIRHVESEKILLDHFLNMMLAGWVTTHQEPLLTDNLPAALGENFVNNKYDQVASALSMPFMHQGKLIGILNLIRLKESLPFGERELRLLTILTKIFGQFIQNAQLHDKVFEETLRLRKEVQDKYAFHGIIGQSPQLKAVFSLLERVIPTDARVLMEGESGTGKELVARVIHYGGPRRDKPFVAVDCGALPANLLEGELFGYLKGAFTGAHRDKKGLFEVANGGTLFLDEIVNMPMEVQSKFLRAIQEGEIRPLGSTTTRKVDVRIIAAASSNLQENLENGTFRQDLYYRLNVISVKLPPLRDRQGDVAILANHFLQRLAEKHHKSIKGFKAETMAHLEGYNWPGNVRELENIVERMVILAEDGTDYLPVDLLPAEICPPSIVNLPPKIADTSGGDIKNKRNAYEKIMLLEALVKNNWNQSAAARHLGISERTVRYKMQKLNIQKPADGSN